MNILVTATGSLSGQCVISSLKMAGHHVTGCDIYPRDWVYNSGLVDNFFQAPRCNDVTHYMDFITNLCTQQDIDILFPLTDTEVDVLSQHREQLPPRTLLALSSEQAITLCRDKYAWFKKLSAERTISTIPTSLLKDWDTQHGSFPMILKPRQGRSSEKICFAESENAVDYFKSTLDAAQFIIQPVLSGDVFVVDVVRDKAGHCAAVARKELLRSVNGAGLTVEMVNHARLISLATEIAQLITIQGCINIEFIYDGEEFFVMDINPRFSAGVEFSVMSGYDIVIEHLNCFTGNKIRPVTPGETTLYSRHYVAEKIIPRSQ